MVFIGKPYFLHDFAWLLKIVLLGKFIPHLGHLWVLCLFLICRSKWCCVLNSNLQGMQLYLTGAGLCCIGIAGSELGSAGSLVVSCDGSAIGDLGPPPT